MSDVRVGAESRGPRGERGPKGPTGPTGAAGAAGAISDLAGAYVNGDDGSAFAQTGFSSIVRVTDGHYVLTLADPPADDNLILPLAIPHSPVLSGTPVIDSVTGGVITLFTYITTTGLLNDMNFYIRVGAINS